MIIHDRNPILQLLDLMTAWYGPPKPEYRVPSSQIPSFVPEPLRMLYEFCGNWPNHQSPEHNKVKPKPGLLRNQDSLRGIDDLEVKEDRLVFLDENQCVFTCETLVNEKDPPVFSDVHCYFDPGFGHMVDYASDMGVARFGPDSCTHQVCQKLSHFLVTFTLQELIFGSRHLYTAERDFPSPEYLVKGCLDPLWLDGIYVYREPTHSFFLCENKLMVMQACIDDSYWIAMNEESAFVLIANPEAVSQIS